MFLFETPCNTQINLRLVTIEKKNKLNQNLSMGSVYKMTNKMGLPLYNWKNRMLIIGFMEFKSTGSDSQFQRKNCF